MEHKVKEEEKMAKFTQMAPAKIGGRDGSKSSNSGNSNSGGGNRRRRRRRRRNRRRRNT